MKLENHQYSSYESELMCKDNEIGEKSIYMKFLTINRNKILYLIKHNLHTKDIKDINLKILVKMFEIIIDIDKYA